MRRDEVAEHHLQVTEQRLSRLSVLQELTVAAMALFDPQRPVDAFLERCAERLGCVAVLWLRGGAGPATLVGAAGLSAASARLPLSALDGGALDAALPYPELAGEGLSRWSVDVSGGADSREREVLVFAFGAAHLPQSYRPMVERLAEVVANAVAHRRVLADLRASYQELARTQQALIQHERLAALGELSAVVAHEVRNPLAVIFNALASLRRTPLARGEPAPMLEIVEQEADRLNKMVSDLLEFARPAELSVQVVALDELLQEALAAARSAHPDAANVNLELRVDPSLRPVALDARLVRQAVINLVSNSIQAMPGGGRVQVVAGPELRDGQRRVRIEVADDGPGIPAEVRARIFQPFFTTKALGTGLGMAIVKRIAEAHAGEVSVRSEVGRGTTVTLELPVAPGGR